MSTEYFTEADLISVYTRRDALEDGVLVELDPELCKEAGLVCPVDVTSSVWNIIEPNEQEQGDGQDVTGRTWDVLNLTRYTLRAASNRETWDVTVRFPCAFWMKRPEYRSGRRGQVTIQLKAVLGGDFDGTPCITVMLPDED